MKPQEILKQVSYYVEQHHKNDYSGHDFEHIKRVRSLAKQIAATEPQADLFTVELVALMHDLDDYKLVKGESHNTEELLKKLKVSSPQIANITNIINSIGFSKNGPNPQLPNLEAKILYDADKIDGMGAIGVARAFAYGGNKLRMMFNPQQLPEEFDLIKYQQRSLNGGNHTVNHFFDKLLKMAYLMQTAHGHKLAMQRQQTMIDFLDAFFAEQGLVEWQLLLKHHLEQYAA
jgi:uncharacterized protein